jgi:hypothetical protein
MTDRLTLEQRANTPCYVGRTTKPTKHNPVVGTIVCALVDDGRDLAGAAKEIAKWVREGLVIERVPVWWVRLHLLTTEVYREGETAA